MARTEREHGDVQVLWHAQGEHELPAGVAWLSPREIERATGMRFAKRRNDYLLGRFAAKRAVAMHLGWGDAVTALAQIEVANAESGAPELRLADRPASLRVSLTDRAGWGVCALAEMDLRVGCDLELVEPRTDTFVCDYLTAAETERVYRAVAGDARHEVANLVWSAKESALKVLETGLRRDTRSVEVVLGEGESKLGWRPLSVKLREGGRLPGWWRRLGHFVLSLVAARDIPPPRAMREPGALARATPSHAWLADPLAPFAPAIGTRPADGGGAERKPRERFGR